MAHKRSTNRSRAPSSSASATTSARSSRPAANLSPQARAQLSTRAQGTQAPRPSARKPDVFPPASAQKRLGWLGKGRFPLSTNQLVFGVTFIVLVAIVVLAVVKGLQQNVDSSSVGLTNTTPLAPGKRAPDFKNLPAAGGGTGGLSGYGGKVILLEFFAPWCPHCRNEVSTLNQIAQTYSNQGVQVLSVSASPYGYNYEDTGDTTQIKMADVQKFVTTFHVSYPALLDTSLRVGNAYGVAGYPTIYVIDRNGVVYWNNGQGGETSYQQLQTEITKALAVPLATATPTSVAHGTATPAAPTATPKK
jgi:peroxiredoxin